MYGIDDSRKIGMGLSAAGVAFTMLGVLLFFDRGLLAMGNLLFLSGISLTMGLRKTGRFFFQAHKWKGTTCFFLGIFLVLYGWAFFGILIEGWGFLNLFGDFFPTALGVMRNLPIIGTFLNLAPVRAVTDRLIAKSRLPI